MPARLGDDRHPSYFTDQAAGLYLGTALAFLIGFRNNSAYGRWWEGQRQTLIRLQIAFAWRLNRYLRQERTLNSAIGLP